MRSRPSYLRPILRRLLRERPEVIQDDLAAALDRDRSGIAHQLSGTHHLPADELDVWCDVLDSIEPLDAIARRLGYRVVPQERAGCPVTVERGGWELLEQVGAFGRRLGAALEDGRLDDEERACLRRALLVVRDTVERLLARLPEVSGG